MADKLYSERKIKRRFFGLRSEYPKALPGQALVLTGGGHTFALLPGQQATPGEAVYGGYDTIYAVDMGTKDFKYIFSAPAKGGDVSFRVTFSAGYRVSDPVEVVNRHIQDPTSMLERVITEAVSKITAVHDIEDVEKALTAIRAASDKRQLGEKIPFVLDTVNVSLELDNEAKTFLRKRREQRRQATLARESAGLAEATAEVERQKKEFALQTAGEQQAFELELARKKVEMELKIQKMRLDVYRPMIEGGLWNVLIQQLAQNPDDIGRVTEVMLQAHSQKVQSDLVMLKALIDGDVIQDHHLHDVTTRLIQNLEQNIGVPLQIGQLQEKKQLPDKDLTSEKKDDTPQDAEPAAHEDKEE